MILLQEFRQKIINLKYFVILIISLIFYKILKHEIFLLIFLKYQIAWTHTISSDTYLEFSKCVSKIYNLFMFHLIQKIFNSRPWITKMA